MSGLIKYRFRGVDGKKISDTEHIEDYASAEAYERVRIGSLCLYYRDLMKKYYVPYEYIDRVYTKVVTCPENEFSNNEEYYRMILIHCDKEFADLILQKQDTVNALYCELEKKNPDIVFGTK